MKVFKKAAYDIKLTCHADLGMLNYCILNTTVDKPLTCQLKFEKPGFQPISPKFLTILHTTYPSPLCFSRYHGWLPLLLPSVYHTPCIFSWLMSSLIFSFLFSYLLLPHQILIFLVLYAPFVYIKVILALLDQVLTDAQHQTLITLFYIC